MPINPVGAGKGSLPRKVSYDKYYDNHERIFGKSGVPHGKEGPASGKDAESVLPPAESTETDTETNPQN